MIDRKKGAIGLAGKLFENIIEDVNNGSRVCNAEYVNRENGHTIIITGCKPLLSDDGELVIGLLVDPKKKPANYVMGTRCWMNGRELPILTDEMIMKGKF